MSSTERHEILAKAFYYCTQWMAPGKDVPAALWQPPYEERLEKWNQWNRDNQKIINAMLKAFKAIKGDV